MEFHRQIRTIAWIALAVLAAVIFLTAAMLFANSRGPRWMAGLFGGLLERIRDNQAETVVVTLGIVAAAWIAIGLAVAVQEWRVGRLKR